MPKILETQFGAYVKAIRYDNDPEFILPVFYAQRRISHHTSCVSTPQKNGKVERKHQSILNIAGVLLIQASLLHTLWNYEVAFVIFLHNRVASQV